MDDGAETDDTAQPARPHAARGVLLGLFASVVIATLPFVEVLTGSKTAMYGDVNDLHTPLYVAAWRNIADGQLPFWSHGTFAGQNLLGSGQSAMFYPVNVLFGLFEPVTAYRWWLLLHIWIAASGAFLWAWWRWRSVAGATVAGFAFALNGFVVLHIVHMPFVATAAWMPFTFLGVELLIERWTLPRAALGAGAVAMTAVSGHGQGLWMTLVGVGIVVVVRLARSGGGWRPWVRAGGGVAVGLALGSVQIIPQYLFSRTSARAELTLEGAFELAARPRHLWTLVLPHIMGGGADVPGMSGAWTGGDIYHEVANYLGITVLLLACIGVARQWRDRRVVALVALAVFALLTSLGGHTPFGRLVYTLVPLAGTFRGWARDLLWMNLAVCCLAALGVREALTLPRQVLTRLVAVVSVVAVAVRLLPVVTDLSGSIAPNGAAAAVGIPLVLLFAALGAVALAGRWPRWGVVAIVVVCAIDMVTFTVSSPWRTSGHSPQQLAAFYGDSPPSFGVPADAAGGVDRWVSDTYGFRMVSLVKDIQGINGYDSLFQADFSETAGGLAFDGYPRRPDFWEPGWLNDVLRVTTLVASPSVQPTDDSWTRDRVLEDIGFVRWTRQPRVPEAAVVGAVQIDTLDGIRARLRDADSDFTGTAYVEAGAGVDAAGLSAAGVAGTASGSMDAAGRGHYLVAADRPSMLVVAYGWLDGWSATVDGRATPVVRANGLVLGVQVPEGRHEVSLRFQPPGLRAGMLLAGLALIGAVAPSAIRRWRRRGSAADEPVAGHADT